jgi:hypothetical protein
VIAGLGAGILPAALVLWATCRRGSAGSGTWDDRGGAAGAANDPALEQYCRRASTRCRGSAPRHLAGPVGDICRGARQRAGRRELERLVCAAPGAPPVPPPRRRCGDQPGVPATAVVESPNGRRPWEGEDTRFVARVRRACRRSAVAAGAAGTKRPTAAPAAAMTLHHQRVGRRDRQARRRAHHRRAHGLPATHFVYWDLSTEGPEGIEVLGAAGPPVGDPDDGPYALAVLTVAWMETGTRPTWAESIYQPNFDVIDVTARSRWSTWPGAARRWATPRFSGVHRPDVAVESRDVASPSTCRGVTRPGARRARLLWARSRSAGRERGHAVDPLRPTPSSRVASCSRPRPQRCPGSGPGWPGLAEERWPADEANRAHLGTPPG